MDLTFSKINPQSRFATTWYIHSRIRKFVKQRNHRHIQIDLIKINVDIDISLKLLSHPWWILIPQNKTNEINQ